MCCMDVYRGLFLLHRPVSRQSQAWTFSMSWRNVEGLKDEHTCRICNSLFFFLGEQIDLDIYMIYIYNPKMITKKILSTDVFLPSFLVLVCLCSKTLRWVLFTTANFPDVMIPIYTEHRASFFFFFLHLGMASKRNPEFRHLEKIWVSCWSFHNYVGVKAMRCADGAVFLPWNWKDK